MSKRYYVMFESDRIDLGKTDHYYAAASSIKTCKQYFSRIRSRYADDNPRNIRVYDTYGDIDPETDFVPVVYREA